LGDRRSADTDLAPKNVPSEHLGGSKLLLECNTRQQPFAERPIRLKSRQMLVFFAFGNGWRVPDCGQVNEFDRIRLALVLGSVGTGLFLKCDGDRHEENGFVGNGADNDNGFGFRG
jgi:hypothetical protein